MNINSNMLKKWLKVPDNILELTNQHIIEVDEYKKLNDATKLVTGHVLTCIDHPNSDHLHLTTVDLGDRVEQIVCGAANVAAGQYVIVAQVGSILPGNFEIKASKIRGESSNGMICSLAELGYQDKDIPEAFKKGIYYFDQPVPIGVPALSILDLDGFVMTLGLTPNRSDLLSVLGYAYDLAAVTKQKIQLPTFSVPELGKSNPVKIEIETDGCGRYYARYLSNITIKESPWWLKNALLSANIHPINNVVDISNYVLLEYGTPLHTFDATKVKTNQIIVRNAKSGETVVSLDDETRVLDIEDVVITNGKEAIAIGGVMGLANTMIDDETTKVILEAAYFDPKSIQKTSKRLGLRSDSSLRFERGVDATRIRLGLERATELLIELADAKVYQGVSQKIRYEQKREPIAITLKYVNQALDIKLTTKQLVNVFERLNYQIKINDKTLYVIPPSYRADVVIDADVLEEIARLYGFNRIAAKPLNLALSGRLSDKQKRLRFIRHHLASIGLNEVITYSLGDQKRVHDFQNLGEPITILSPLSEDKKTLRQSLLNGLLDTVSYNQSRQIQDVAIFEIGHLYAKDYESTYLAAALSGTWQKTTWKKDGKQTDFYLVKGIVEHLFKSLDIEISFKASQDTAAYHPYQQATILHQDQAIGRLALIHPLTQKALDVEPTVVFEIHLEPLLSATKQKTYQTLSKYPSISRDLAVIVNEDVMVSDLLAMIKQTAKDKLTHLEVFDVYQGEHIEPGKKSLGFGLIFNDSTKTLSGEEVDQAMKKIINRLSFSYQAQIRQ